MTDDELQEKLAYWQRRLRLQDWFVTARHCTIREVEPDCSGKTSINWSAKAATIRILPRADWGDWPPISATMDEEETLVHELLHLAFCGFEKNRGLKADLQHQAINTIAAALIAEHRSTDARA